MLTAAWKTFSQCCTCREQRDTPNVLEHARRTKHEKIDEIASLLTLLRPPQAAVEHLGEESVEGKEVRSRSPTAKAANSNEQGHCRNVEETNPQKPKRGVFAIGIKNWLEGRERPSGENSVRNDENKQSGASAIHKAFAGRVEGHSIDISEHTQQSSPKKGLEASRSSELDSEAADPGFASGGEVGATKHATRSAELPSTDWSSDVSVPAFDLEDSQYGEPYCQRAHLEPFGHADTPVWSLKRHVSFFGEAVSSSLARAATQALPVIRNILQEGKREDTDHSLPIRGRIQEKLISVARDSTLEALRSSSWLSSPGASQSPVSLRPQPQLPTQFVGFPSNAAPKRQSGIATNYGNDTTATFPQIPQTDNFHAAPLAPPITLDALPLKTEISSGPLDDFCLLGASVGRDEKLSFQRRPFVTRPLGMSMKTVTNMLGAVSLTGDSLGRKSHWCAVLKATAEAGVESTYQDHGRPRQQRQLEHVLLLQLLQQQQRMMLLPSSINGSQQVSICRANNLWMGVVVQGIGFEGPLAADFVAVELTKVGKNTPSASYKQLL